LLPCFERYLPISVGGMGHPRPSTQIMSLERTIVSYNLSLSILEDYLNSSESTLGLTTFCHEIFDMVVSQPLAPGPPNHHNTTAMDCSNIPPLVKAFYML
jgi:hypothetical protein